VNAPSAGAGRPGGSETTIERIRTCGVLPVVTIDRAEDALRLGEVLLAGGLGCAEVTLRTDAALGAIAAMTGSHPEMLVGAGTVLTVEQARSAIEAGGRFVVSPGFDEEVVEWCLARDVTVLPGVMTPTEIMKAVRHGLGVVKFFPAEPAGGTAALDAVGAAFPDMQFVPTGGIGAGNLESYLRLSMVAACGGSWLAGRHLIADGDFHRIELLVAEAADIVRRVRGDG
jgi:2-dehydro-3-deoxyphosphogluconate aldolase/(4S)-4-hydroxy-2-oxoglutarate aldolase